MNFRKNIYITANGKKTRNSLAGVDFSIVKEPSDQNEVVLYFFEHQKFPEMEPIIITDFIQPLPFEEYKKRREQMDPTWEGIVWGIQYAINSYAVKQDKAFRFIIKIKDTHYRMASQNLMYSFLMIEGILNF